MNKKTQWVQFFRFLLILTLLRGFHGGDCIDISSFFFSREFFFTHEQRKIAIANSPISLFLPRIYIFPFFFRSLLHRRWWEIVEPQRKEKPQVTNYCSPLPSSTNVKLTYRSISSFSIFFFLFFREKNNCGNCCGWKIVLEISAVPVKSTAHDRLAPTITPRLCGQFGVILSDGKIQLFYAPLVSLCFQVVEHFRGCRGVYGSLRKIEHRMFYRN